jgi:hypothetical protein
LLKNHPIKQKTKKKKKKKKKKKEKKKKTLKENCANPNPPNSILNHLKENFR